MNKPKKAQLAGPRLFLTIDLFHSSHKEGGGLSVVVGVPGRASEVQRTWLEPYGLLSEASLRDLAATVQGIVESSVVNWIGVKEMMPSDL